MRTNLVLFTVIVLFILPSLALAHSFQSGNVKLSYREYGSGIPLIVLNGGPGRSSDTFVPLAEKLAELGFKAIIFDQRGTGESKVELTEKNITLELMVEDLENLRKNLKLETVSILGHSFGGMYAMAYASKYPNQVRSLVLSASAGINLSWKKYIGANFLSKISPESREKVKYWEKIEEDQRKKKQDHQKANLEVMKLLVPAYVYNPKFIPQLEKDLPNPKVSNALVNHLIWRSAERTYDLKGAFKNFKAPTLIIAGRQDILGEEVPLTIHREIPGSRLLFLNECAHYPWLDQPAAYFSAIKDFHSL